MWHNVGKKIPPVSTSNPVILLSTICLNFVMQRLRWLSVSGHW